jgi:hypothetical protein
MQNSSIGQDVKFDSVRASQDPWIPFFTVSASFQVAKELIHQMSAQTSMDRYEQSLAR